MEKIFDGIRELRTAIITGYMILFIVFILTNQYSESQPTLTPSLKFIYELIGNLGLIILISVFAYLVGVSYLYWLETIVNKIHLRFLKTKFPCKINSKIRNYYFNNIYPFSENSYLRLQKRINELVEQKKIPQLDKDGNQTKDYIEFKEDLFRKVKREILWIDGRLNDDKLNTDFIRMNTEGFFRISIGLLIPFVTIALLIELNFCLFDRILIVCLSIFSAHWLIIQGFYLHKKSTSMLAHHIADGNLNAPSMNQL